MPSLQRTGEEITEIYNRQVNTVYKICFSFMKNTHETEDMVQETFLRLISSGMNFMSEEHEKAWLIVTASNLCKDALKKWWRRTEDITDPSLNLKMPPFEIDDVMEAILKLPNDQKTVVYMHYYEGYIKRLIRSVPMMNQRQGCCITFFFHLKSPQQERMKESCEIK